MPPFFENVASRPAFAAQREPTLRLQAPTLSCGRNPPGRLGHIVKCAHIAPGRLDPQPQQHFIRAQFTRPEARIFLRAGVGQDQSPDASEGYGCGRLAFAASN
jgi:hypothetical protein